MYKRPAISVIMPAYNSEKYISLAIDSILKQSFRNFEFIIIDDASTDQTWQIISRFAKKDRRIIALKNKKNLKLSRSLNKGILIAKGKYIARMDADDWSYPYRLQKQLNYMEKNPEVGISGGIMEICDEKLATVAERSYQLEDVEIRKRIFLYSPFSHPLVIIRSGILKKSGLYDHNFNPAEDVDLYFRIGKYSKFGNLKDTLIKYRVIPNSMTTGLTLKMEIKTLEIRKKYSKTKPYYMSYFDKLYNFVEILSLKIIPNKIRLFFFGQFRNSGINEQPKINQRLVRILLTILVLAGFLFRLSGIIDNHSFWADEAYISSIGRDIAQNKLTLSQAFSLGGQSYQQLNIIISALAIKIFGLSEFSTRIPIVFFGTLSIFFAFLLAKKLSNEYGGIMAAFFIALSELQLAHSTQAKPYIILQCILFLILYLLLQTRTTGYGKLFTHLIIVALLLTAPFVHYFGILFWLIYGVFLLTTLIYSWKKIRNKTQILSLTLLSAILIGFIFGIHRQIGQLFTFKNELTIFAFDNTMYLKNLLLRQYGIFFLPAVLSLFFIWNKNKGFVLGTGVWVLTLLFLWNFRSYSHNIRYLVPLFGLGFVLFGVFFAKVGKKFTGNKSWLPCLVVTLLLIIFQYKIVLTPRRYYSPNRDLYGDVQVANYKDLYWQLKIRFPQYNKIPIYNDLIDAHRWYMPEHMPAGYFTKESGKTMIGKNNVDGKPVYRSLNHFLKIKKENPVGLLIVEDWESFLPEDIKQHAKKNLQLEIRIDSLPYAKKDPWPLEIYSWGFTGSK